MNETSPPTRRLFLEEALRIVDGPRNDTYGKPEDSFRAIAELWNVYLGLRAASPLEPWDVALMMDLVKTARLIGSSGQHLDSWIDKAGYAACGAEVGAERP